MNSPLQPPAPPLNPPAAQLASTSSGSEVEALRFFPIADTISSSSARSDPAGAIAHYERLASRLWIAPQVREVAQQVLGDVGKGRVAWCSAVGPYGFGKTATSITLWRHAREQGFWAIPPLSCTNFDELAHGIAALLCVMQPRQARAIGKLFEEVWSENVSRMTERDANAYGVDARTMRRILSDKLQAGELAVDSRPHRLVEFLSRLGALASREGRGLVIVLDELQQLLGTLDARSIIAFREFVWGIRTEHAPCAVFLSMDSLLEARLARWAADILHRIREHGPVLRLADIYSEDFPRWLWEQAEASSPALRGAMSEDVLLSLGQFVERPDLASGPRTVVDTFARAASHWSTTQSPYDLEHFTHDLHDGRLRYFGEGAPVQRALRDVLADEWIAPSPARSRWVRVLAAFPSGCPAQVLERFFPDVDERQRLRGEMFGPLMVSLPGGLALESLQRVRRSHANWESVVARCWEHLPALDVVAARMPDVVGRVLVPKLLPSPSWKRQGTDTLFSLEGEDVGEWTRWRGSFSPDFPNREVALWLGASEPQAWPPDADVSLALVCQPQEDAEASLSLDAEHGRLTLRLPVLRALHDPPADLERFTKYLEPEPFRPATILLAVHELASLLDIDEPQSMATANAQVVVGEAVSVPATARERQEADRDSFGLEHARAFVNTTLDFLVSEMLGGHVAHFQLGTVGKATKNGSTQTTGGAGVRRMVRLRGMDALRGAFVALCRARFADYQTLQTTPRWSEGLSTLRDALAHPSLSPAQRAGKQAVTGSKAAIVKRLFHYPSTAAFDSYAGALGALLKAEGEADNWSLRFALHPAETALLDYVRRAGRGGVPSEAVREFGQHRGYGEEETAHLVRLLEARGLLERRASGRLFSRASDNSRRETLGRETEALQAALASLGREFHPASPGQTAQEQRDALLQQVEAAVAEMAVEAQSLHHQAVSLVGELRAHPTPQEFPDGTYRTHLGGIARTLAMAHTALITEGRKLHKAVEEHAAPARADDVAWALAWRQAGGSFREANAGFTSRAREYLTRRKYLVAWRDASLREAALRTRVQSLSNSQPDLARQLAALTQEFSVLFALRNWEPLSQVSRFDAALGRIESELQGTLWSQVEALLRQSEALRSRWNRFLPPHDLPLGAPGEGEEPQAWMQRAFDGLHFWALQSFEREWQRCQKVKQEAARWRHPTNGKKKWDEWSREMEAAIERAQEHKTPQALQQVGERLQATANGFDAASLDIKNAVGVHEPTSSGADRVDFERLKLLYQQGRVRITVDNVEPHEASPQVLAEQPDEAGGEQ